MSKHVIVLHKNITSARVVHTAYLVNNYMIIPVPTNSSSVEFFASEPLFRMTHKNLGEFIPVGNGSRKLLKWTTIGGTIQEE